MQELQKTDSPQGNYQAKVKYLLTTPIIPEYYLTMAYLLSIKEKAIGLRKKGYPIKEVSKILGIAQSTSSLWLRNITLNKIAKQRLKEKKAYGQFKAHLAQKIRRKRKIEEFNNLAIRNFSGVSTDNISFKLLYPFLF